jgi:hypothetical protein
MKTFEDHHVFPIQNTEEFILRAEWSRVGITDEEQKLIWSIQASRTLPPTNLAQRVHPSYVSTVADRRPQRDQLRGWVNNLVSLMICASQQ